MARERKKPLSGLIPGPGPNKEIIAGYTVAGNKTVKPLTFLGGTVLSFNSSLGIGPLEESSLSVELINDCFVDPYNFSFEAMEPPGNYFLGEINIGAPVFFDLGEATAPEDTRAEFKARVAEEELAASGKAPSYFKFGGILQSYTAKQTSSGLTFDARVVDPRSLLNGITVVVGNTLSGPIKHRNYYNVYAYYEYAVLKPERREIQPKTGYTIFGTVEQDVPVDLTSAHTGLNPPLDITGDVDCRVYGSSSRDDRGMRYHKVLEALRNMNPLAYSPNYGEEFSPELDGIELAAATVGLQWKHQRNVFSIDLSDLPYDEVPAYYRVAGPSTTLLDIINDVCEATGRIFHVTLEKSTNPLKNHTIKIITQSIKKIKQLDEDDIRSEINQYNGASTDLTYGKELTTDKTRTLLLGEQKHEMYESINIEPFFGEDKYGEPITPIKPTEEEDTDNCGWKIKIYLDELNDTLRCPLYDYSLEEGDGRENTVVSRKVVVSEYHLRLAASGYEIWKRWVFNPLNNDDLATVIRRNFPNYSTAFMNTLYGSLRGIREHIDEDVPPEVSGAPSDFASGSAPRSITDLMNQWNADMLAGMEKKQSEAIESVYNWLAQFARSNYGVNYVASVSKDLCVARADYVDLSYIDSAGIKVGKNYTVYDDPCSDTTKATVVNKMWQPRIFTHIPTNEGAWVEKCGGVLGLGGKEDDSNSTNIYLNFFRSEDNRITPMARFDSKLLSRIYRSEGLIDDGMGYLADQNQITEAVASFADGPFDYDMTEPTQEEIEKLLFTSGLCGDLDIKDWNPDDYVRIRYRSNCAPPPLEAEDVDLLDSIDFPTSVWAKCSVGDKIYIDDSGCLKYTDKVIEPVQLVNDPCCGKYQAWSPLQDCYWANGPATLPDEDCVVRNIVTKEKTVCSGIVKIPFTMDQPCFTRYCDDQNQMEMLAQEMETLIGSVFDTGLATLDDENQPATYDPSRARVVTKDGTVIQRTDAVCYTPKPSGIALVSAVLDFNSNNNHKIQPVAFIPTAVAIPVKSNIETYGPWKSSNFETSSGGVELVHDPDLNPWIFNSAATMDTFAGELVNDRAYNKTEIETGSVTIPLFPDKSLGFIENGPNLTNINVSMGAGGVTTTYNFKTYTPKFGGMKALEKNALKENMALINKVRKLSQDKTRRVDSINRKLKNGGTYRSSDINPKLTEQGTLHRLLVGETYPFSQLWKKDVDDFIITGSGERTVVGSETLEKSVVELRYDYRKKAFMSFDGLFSPVRNSGTDPSGTLPMYARYDYEALDGSGFSRGSPDAPIPPALFSGTEVNNIAIDRRYLDPLQNPFDKHPLALGSGGAGHNIDIVGRGSGVPGTGIVMSFYGKRNWKDRYSDEYRFLGLRGPLVLHQWGFDTQGKPIPNAIDDHEKIRKSGIFSEKNESGVGLTDYFMDDWLQKPTAWPVAPVDLRFDRKRGVWVSPPSHKIVVVETASGIGPNKSGLGYLINQKDTYQYGKQIYNSGGVLIEADHNEGDEEQARPQIIIEDRIGAATSAGQKSYAYYDSFTNSYLLMGGTPGIRIGKFCNQWPSLSNVKDPKNAVKQVVLYETKGCQGCNLWDLQPEMQVVNGVSVPVVVDVINLFANVGAHEYQTKWCSVAPMGSGYVLMAAEF